MQSVGTGLIGAVVGPVVLVALALAAGWRTALYAVATIGFLGAAALGTWLRVPVSAEQAVMEAARRRAWQAPQLVLRNSNVRRCALISILMVGWLLTSGTFYPIYLVRSLHLSTAQMGAMMAAFGAGGACGGVVVPYYSDRVGRRLAVLTGCLLGLIAPLFALTSPQSATGVGIALFISALAGGTIPLFMGTIPTESLPRDQAPAGVGLVQAVGEILGGVTLPLLSGVLADCFGLHAMMWVLAGSALAAAIAAMGLVDGNQRRGTGIWRNQAVSGPGARSEH